VRETEEDGNSRGCRRNSSTVASPRGLALLALTRATLTPLPWRHSPNVVPSRLHVARCARNRRSWSIADETPRCRSPCPAESPAARPQRARQLASRPGPPACRRSDSPRASPFTPTALATARWRTASGSRIGSIVRPTIAVRSRRSSPSWARTSGRRTCTPRSPAPLPLAAPLAEWPPRNRDGYAHPETESRTPTRFAS
jgi:hypothetical protein